MSISTVHRNISYALPTRCGFSPRVFRPAILALGDLSLGLRVGPGRSNRRPNRGFVRRNAASESLCLSDYVYAAHCGADSAIAVSSRAISSANSPPCLVKLLSDIKTPVWHLLCGLRTCWHVLKGHRNQENDLPKRKKSIRRAWTKDDVRKLKSLAKQKVGVAKIALALNRTVAAATMKASLLGVSLDTRG